MRRAARTDSNQKEIVGALRAAGCMVHSTASLGGGFPDLLVGFGGRLTLLEVKDGSKPPSARKLTPDEERFHRAWKGYPVHVVGNVLQALVSVGVMVQV